VQKLSSGSPLIAPAKIVTLTSLNDTRNFPLAGEKSDFAELGFKGWGILSILGKERQTAGFGQPAIFIPP
jgi:hypothetical protein